MARHISASVAHAGRGRELVSNQETVRSEAPAAAPRNAAPLELDRVTKQYPGEARPALEELSISVPAGEICVLVGPSGCGKTTAMRLVNRLIDLTSGDIRLGGESITTRNVHELRREIGYVIQQVGLFPHLSIAANIATVPRLLGWKRARIDARVEELFRRLHDKVV